LLFIFVLALNKNCILF